MTPNDTLIVGVDIHRRRNVVQVMDSHGHILTEKLSLANNRHGTDDLVQHLALLARAGNVATIRLAAEATGYYWLPFFVHLEQAPSHLKHPLRLYLFNPRLTANFRKAFSRQDKSDPLDAHVIAERLRFGHDLPVPFRMDELYFHLRTLTRHRFHLVRELVRVKSYTLPQIYLKASDYTLSGSERPFDSAFTATSQAVLLHFHSMEEVAAMPLADLAEWLDEKGKRRFADPESNARRLQRVARTSYRLPTTWLNSVNMAVSLSLRHIKALQQLLNRIDTAIVAVMEAFPNTLTTIPGIGPVFAAGIIAEIGHLRRFNYSQAKVAGYAGLQWKRTQTGNFEAEETPRQRGGNAFLRYYLCEAAQLVRMHAAEYEAFYQRKFDEVPKHKHKRALVLTARKLVRLVVRLLTTNEPYRARMVPSEVTT